MYSFCQKICFCLVFLFVSFFCLSQSKTKSPDSFVIYPSLVELKQGNNEIVFGIGGLQLGGTKKQDIIVFPFTLQIKSKNTNISVQSNFISFFTASRMKIGKNIVVKARDTYNGDIISIGGNVDISGTVTGKVIVFGADVYLKSSANVRADVVALGGKVISSRGSRVNGSVLNLKDFSIPFIGILSNPHFFRILLINIEVLKILFFILIFYLVLYFFQNKLNVPIEKIKSDKKSVAFASVLFFILFPVLLFLLSFSFIGILFLPLLILFFVIIVLWGYLCGMIYAGTFIGKSSDSGNITFMMGIKGILIVQVPFLLARIFGAMNNIISDTVGGIINILGLIITIIICFLGIGGIISTRLGSE